MPFENDKTDLLDIKTIDRDRGIILRDVTPFLPDMMPRFVLEWGDQDIPFGGNYDGALVENENDKNKLHLTWTINHIDLPKNFKETEDALLQIITEALDAFGEFHDRTRVHKVTVNFEKDVFTNTVPPHWSDVV